MKKILVPLALTATCCAVAAPALGAGKTVRVLDSRFKAKTIHVAKGTTVTWRWKGSDSHNVKFHGFRSKTQNKGTYRHTFNTKGTFRYVCTLHRAEGMKGTVVVG